MLSLAPRFLLPASLFALALAACGGGGETNATSTSSSSSSGTGGSSTTTSSSSSTTTSSGTGGAATTSSSSSSTTSSSGTGGCTPMGTGGQGGAINPDDACGSLTAPGAPAERVVWVTKSDEKIEITNEISLLWAFQYAARVPPDKAAEYTLEHERCEQAAGDPEHCTTFTLQVPTTDCAVAFAPKFGIDPSQYKPGTNRYSYALRLMHGCQIVSQDKFTTIVNYTP